MDEKDEKGQTGKEKDEKSTKQEGQGPRAFQDYEERKQRLRSFTWAFIVIYMMVVLALSALSFIMDLEDGHVLLLNIVVVGVGAPVVIALVIYPYFKGTRMPELPEGTPTPAPPADSVDLSRPWKETVSSPIIILTILLVLVFYTVVNMVWESEEQVMGMVVMVILAVVLVIFGQLKVECDAELLSFHFGPLGKKAPLSELLSIRACSVHPLKEFKGWGFRFGFDGSIGYIAAGKVGVRIHLENGKQYVVTVADPQGLVDYVRAAQEQAGLKKAETT